LEFVVAVILVVVAWQIGLALAPTIMRWLGGLKQDVDAAADQAFTEPDQDIPNQQSKKEHTNGTHR
jgi:hypothetical protein